MANKRYYWLKLNENFFEDDTIEWIEEQENGERYVLFYLKLCLRSLKDEGSLIRYVGEKLIPYDVKALAKLTNTDQDTVAVSLKVFEEIGLIERTDTGELYMKQINEMIGTETDSARRVRKHRARQNQIDENKKEEQGLLQCNADVTKSNTEIELETELELDLETHTEKEQIENIVCVLDKKISFEEGKKILKIANNNIDLIKEKYEVAKVSEYNNLVGFMVNAIREDWGMPKKQVKYKSKVDTKFHNFENRTSKYSPEELNKIVLGK